MSLAAWSTSGDRADLAGVPRLTPAQLVPALCRGRGPWWSSWGWHNLAEDPANDHEPAVMVLRTFVERIEAGDDPADFLGGVEPEDAAAAAAEWLFWGVPVEAIGGWLAADCWSARVVRSLIDAGIGPDVFYDEDGELLAFEHDTLAPWSLASYVMDGTISVGDVVAESARLRCATA